jgi:hypothetical protein
MYGAFVLRRWGRDTGGQVRHMQPHAGRAPVPRVGWRPTWLPVDISPARPLTLHCDGNPPPPFKPHHTIKSLRPQCHRVFGVPKVTWCDGPVRSIKHLHTTTAPFHFYPLG